MPKKLKAKTEIIYWDTCCFLALLNEETDVITSNGKHIPKVDACRNVMDLAAGGRVKIVTSAITLVEVLRIKAGEHGPPLKKESEEIIHSFFLHDYIAVRDVRRSIAEAARTLVWEHGLRSFDAIHAATCIDARVKLLHTFDPGFYNLNGKYELTVTPPLYEPADEYEEDVGAPKQLDVFSEVDASRL